MIAITNAFGDVFGFHMQLSTDELPLDYSLDQETGS